MGKGRGLTRIPAGAALQTVIKMEETDKYEDVEPDEEISFILWEDRFPEDQQAEVTLNDMLADTDSPIIT